MPCATSAVASATPSSLSRSPSSAPCSPRLPASSPRDRRAPTPRGPTRRRAPRTTTVSNGTDRASIKAFGRRSTSTASSTLSASMCARSRPPRRRTKRRSRKCPTGSPRRTATSSRLSAASSRSSATGRSATSATSGPQTRLTATARRRDRRDRRRLACRPPPSLANGRDRPRRVKTLCGAVERRRTRSSRMTR